MRIGINLRISELDLAVPLSGSAKNAKRILLIYVIGKATSSMSLTKTQVLYFNLLFLRLLRLFAAIKTALGLELTRMRSAGSMAARRSAATKISNEATDQFDKLMTGKSGSATTVFARKGLRPS